MAILVSNRVWFLHSTLESGMFLEEAILPNEKPINIALN